MRISRLVTCAALIALAHAAYAGPTRRASFTFEGPAPIDGIENKVAAGAVQALVFDPAHPDTVWIGTVNGGVWKTTDFHGDQDHAPHWKPMTDDMPGLSIGALSLDPTDASAQTLAAALGKVSSHGGEHGPLAGVLSSQDGGETWTSIGATELAGQDLVGIAARSGNITVASKSQRGGGVFRRPAGQIKFARVADLPALPATSLVGDPQHPSELWVALVGAGGGVFHSPDAGETWKRISDASLDGFAASQDAQAIALSEQGYARDERIVYAVEIISKPADGSTDIPAIFRVVHTGTKVTNEELKAAELPAFETADQARVAVAADPLHDNTFFVGGDEGQLFAVVREVGSNAPPVYTAVSDKVSLDTNDHGHDPDRAVSPPEFTGHGTFPHSDTRALLFVGDHVLVSTDDGGVYARSSPRENTGDWNPKDGDLGITEAYSCAYDHHGHVLVCGTQDNGAVEQPGPGQTEWKQLLIHDGGTAAVSDALFPCPSNPKRQCSRRYFSQQRLGTFSFQNCNGDDGCSKPTPAPLRIAGSFQVLPCSKHETHCADDKLGTLTPLAADRFDAMRLVIAAGSLWESKDGGATVEAIGGFSGTATHAIVLGGQKDGADDKDLLYVASAKGLFARAAPGPVAKTTWDETNGTPTQLDVDRDDFSAVWLVTDQNEVWHGTGVTTSAEAWTRVTGDLAPGDKSAPDMNAIAHVGGASSYVAIGGDDGVYVMATADPGHWAKLTGGLPDVVVDGLTWSKADDVLVIATLGRSTWEIAHASALFDIHLEETLSPGLDQISAPPPKRKRPPRRR